MDLLRVSHTAKHQVHIQCVLQRVRPKPQHTHINFIKRQNPGDGECRPLPTAADAHDSATCMSERYSITAAAELLTLEADASHMVYRVQTAQTPVDERAVARSSCSC